MRKTTKFLVFFLVVPDRGTAAHFFANSFEKVKVTKSRVFFTRKGWCVSCLEWFERFVKFLCVTLYFVENYISSPCKIRTQLLSFSTYPDSYEAKVDKSIIHES